MANKPTMQAFEANSFLFGGSADYLDSLYETYLANPEQLSPEWRQYFSQLPKVNGVAQEFSHAAIRAHFENLIPGRMVVMDGEQVSKQTAVTRLVMAYRRLGHLMAHLDPLNLQAIPSVPQLSLAAVGLSAQDLSQSFYRDRPEQGQQSLADIVKQLQATYCHHMGAEFMHMNDSAAVEWFAERLEQQAGKYKFNTQEKETILEKLVAAETLETYLGKRFVGQKRFSLEGGDSLIPMLYVMLQRGASQGVIETVMGMAHRGRLNVLINILGKPSSELYLEFEGITGSEDFSSDVKYHKGYSADLLFDDKIMHVALAFNPSHLEIVNPVVEGAARERQERLQDTARTKVLPILIHGDAAFAGQGVVAETLNMSQTRGFSTGGTVHIVINNQVGFTTSNPHDSRSTHYATDIAKMIEAPILHVNGDDVEAVAYAANLALDFRMQFHRDVVIDLICYRRHGHNEADEPTMTQPVMYKQIKQQITPMNQYASLLTAAGVITAEKVTQLVDDYRARLDKGEVMIKLVDNAPRVWHIDWQRYQVQDWREPVTTVLPKEKLLALGEKLVSMPADFTLQPQVAREIEARRKMLAGEQPFFWGMAETLAYASLLDEGYPVRLSGQDCGRGTFTHRHAHIYDYETNAVYTPLEHISAHQAPFAVIDSLLSEQAVLGFEYGYSVSDPNRLVIWEAQFGDFFNGAQMVIDQFISAGEQKWGRYSGLTLFLPHGYESMGPEHSSARIERFLQLCAQNNMQVCIPSVPAQMFHLLRRQMLRNYRKPLIVFTPKSLLRHKLAVSSWDDFTTGSFLPVINDTSIKSVKKVTRVIFCSGKVYINLLQERQRLERDDVALIRVEQLYPFPDLEFTQVYQSYAGVKQVAWCQEEPHNQGAWFKVRDDIKPLLSKGVELRYIGRPEAAAPAVGSAVTDAKQQQTLLAEAFEKW